LLTTIDQLDVKAETNPLSFSEREVFRKENDSLNKLRREEESKRTQRAKVKDIQERGII
jgi:hypothetical protein